MVSQFHYGSIEMIYQQVSDVRNIIKSQFHYGSIEISPSLISALQFAMCLNSIMVRLKFLNTKEAFVNLKKSQFHYGSIEMIQPESVPARVAVVSIPLWFD